MITVVIPCYRETESILKVLELIGDEVNQIIVVDDACPEGTGAKVQAECTDRRVEVIVHEKNMGVGGATLTGYSRALELGADIIVKLDGDGQMDPGLIPSFVKPIIDGRADYTKGNRFHNLEDLAGMPKMRVMGNLVLSFATKMSSGYWNIFDPTNGYTAIHAKVAGRLPFGKISKGFFFESDMLFRLNILRAVVVDVAMRARYGDEKSNLKIHNEIFKFSGKKYLNTVKRIFYIYYLRDFNIASIELLLGKLLLLFGIVFGGVKWVESIATDVPATAGTVVLAALPIILGSQLLLAFLDFDTRNIPDSPIYPHL